LSRRVTRSICIKREEHRTEQQQAKEPGQRQKSREYGEVFSEIGLARGLGVLLALVGCVVTPFVAAPAAGAGISLQAVGVLLGVAGYSLVARRLAAATIVLCVGAIFFDLAVSQGLISGVEGYDRGIPAEKPGAQRRGSGEPGRGCLI